MKYLFILTLFLTSFISTYAQVVYDTFNESRVVNGQSTEITTQGKLVFLIQHRFGRINDGFDEFFGIDQASVRMGLDYGISKHLMIGLGRSSYNKTIDGYLKFRLIQQKENLPLSLALHIAATADTREKNTDENPVSFANRLSYISQLIISSKLGSRFSMQIQPVYIHKNLVATPADDNDIYALGSAVRIKLSKIYSFNIEYFYSFSSTSNTTYNPLSFSFDIETKGHFFSIICTNTLGMTEDAFVSETTDSWSNGEMHLGFNITRVFNVNHHR